MTRVAVLVEERAGQVSGPTLEALTLGRSLGDVVAVWLGGSPSESAVASLGAYGAGEVRVVEPELRVASAAAAGLGAATADADVVLFVSTFVNKEIVTRLALATGAGVVVDAAGAEVVDGRVETSQTVFAATWNVRTRIVSEKAIVGI